MAIKSKTFTLLAFIFAVTCLVSLIVAFASDRWFVSSEKEVSGFNNIGLWSACFSRYRPPAWALVDKYYDGCWWVFDREMDDLRQFLFPSWLVGTQVLVTISLTFQLIAMIIMIVNAINCFPYNRFKDVISIGLALASVALHGFTAILLIVAVILFGARADNDRTWIQKPDQNYLSWSFGLCVLAAFVSILTFMTVSVEVHRLRLLRRGGSDPEGFLTNVPPPPTFYAYSKQKFQLSNTGTTDSEKSQPAYANRYGNQDSSGRPRPPNTMFAVSGAGDVYLNRAYMNEGNLQRGRLNGYEPPYERRQLNPPQNQVRRPPDSRVYTDDVDSQRLQNMNSAAKSGESENITSKKGADTNNDYEEAKKIRQPVLPEYVPKLKSENVKKIKLDNTLDESCDTDIPKKKEQDSGDESRERKRTRSNSKSKKSTRSRSNSKTKSKEKKDADNKHSKRRSKKRGSESDNSDKDVSRSRHHSKERTSTRKKRSHSRGSTSRDLSSSNSDSSLESDSASVASRSRQRHRKESSRKNTRQQSASKESMGKEKHRGHTDDMSGSEYKSKKRSKSKGDPTESDAKKRTKSKVYSDTESVRSRQRSKSKGDQTDPDSRKKGKLRDNSDNESVRSKQSRRGDLKPKGTYSSYYEY